MSYQTLSLKLISYKADGSELEHVGQVPAFYALVTCNNELVDYFTTVEAAVAYCNDILLRR